MDGDSSKKSGPLLVRAGLFKRWTQRWFVVEGSALVHYTNSKLTRVVKRYPLKGDHCAAVVSAKGPPHRAHAIRVDGADPRRRKYHFFAALSEAEQTLWTEALNAAGGSSAGTNSGDGKTNVFGVNLQTLKERNDSAFDQALLLPTLVIKCVSFIDEGARAAEEGIFRLGGNHDRIQELRQQFDRGQNPALGADEDVHVIAGLLKLFLRLMPEPLLLLQNYDSLLAVCRDKEQTLPEALTTTIAALPAENRELLLCLSEFLRRVAHHSAVSKMDMKNLATVFGPNLLRGNDDDPIKMMNESDLITRITLCILTNTNQIFGVGDVEGTNAATNAGADLDGHNITILVSEHKDENTELEPASDRPTSTAQPDDTPSIVAQSEPVPENTSTPES